MNWLKEYILGKFLNGYIKGFLDWVSGPLNGKKSEITLGILALIMAVHGTTDAGTLKEALEFLMNQIANVGNVSLDEARNVSLVAFLISVFHRILKWVAAAESEQTPEKKETIEKLNKAIEESDIKLD